MLDKSEAKLNIYFALLPCFCGLMFINVPDLDALPIIATFFALFGLIFVDLLKWFALPPTMAYLALGAIAVYSINRLVTISSQSTEPQMVAVSELLVLVQAVLMMQRKSRRIYEQLAVFALLELVVAAIFNNAISYGMLLIPLGMIAVGALSLLHVHTTSENAFFQRESMNSFVRVNSTESRQSFMAVATSLPWIGVMTIAPSVLAVAFVFFFALPRTSKTSRGSAGAAQVGFNQEVMLGQIGNMMLNPEVAVRIELNDRVTGAGYEVVGDLYVRGTVLESYDTSRDKAGTWSQQDGGRGMSARQLPAEPMRPESKDSITDDEVGVRLTVLPMSGSALFSLPPYHYEVSEPGIVHFSDRWTIGRRQSNIFRRSSQISYQFASEGFQNGTQRKLLPRFAENERPPTKVSARIKPVEPARVEDTSIFDKATRFIEGDERDAPTTDASQLDRRPASDIEIRLAAEEGDSLRLELESSAQIYLQGCLEYDADSIPSAERLAEAVIEDSVSDTRNPVEIAEAMERFLSRSDRFKYTLDLTKKKIAGLDPIEQFLAVDRAGNCQYFASALVQMLRSQGIPARLVVGFNTDEYNALGGHYVARQLHAHAWVEALVDSKWVRSEERFADSDQANQYWMRLDPTPGGGGTTRSTGGRVAEVLDLAQEMWKSYVVDADATNRRRELGAGSEGISGSYQLFYEWVELKIARIRAGELGAGTLAGRELFSWPSAIFVMLLLLGAMLGYQWIAPRWMNNKRKSNLVSEIPAVPSIAFFAEVISLLERLGIHRSPSQTPKEFTTGAAQLLQRDESASLSGPLSELTAAFYQQRFSSESAASEPTTLSGRMERIKAALNRVRDRVSEK